jgi:hypothetical protein
MQELAAGLVNRFTLRMEGSTGEGNEPVDAGPQPAFSGTLCVSSYDKTTIAAHDAEECNFRSHRGFHAGHGLA